MTPEAQILERRTSGHSTDELLNLGRHGVHRGKVAGRPKRHKQRTAITRWRSRRARRPVPSLRLSRLYSAAVDASSAPDHEFELCVGAARTYRG